MKLSKLRIAEEHAQFKGFVEEELRKGTTRTSLRIKTGRNDSFIRGVVAEIAKEQPVVFSSQETGYKILPPKESLTPEWRAYWGTYRDHTVAELKSRVNELTKRIDPLERW